MASPQEQKHATLRFCPVWAHKLAIGFSAGDVAGEAVTVIGSVQLAVVFPEGIKSAYTS